MGGRIRTIKPDFFTDDEIARLGPLCRLLFIGLWTHADREGRLEYRPLRIKAQVLPYDQVEVETLLGELAEDPGRFVILYEVEGRPYVQVRTFPEHQRPNMREAQSIIPPPPPESLTPSGSRAGFPMTRDSAARKGREGKGKEGKEGDGKQPALPRGHLFRELLESFGAAWRGRYGETYIPTAKDRDHLGRLLQSLSPEEAAALPACFLAYLRDPDPFIAEAQRHSLCFFCSTGGLNKYRVTAPIRSVKEARGIAAARQWVGGNGDAPK